MILLSVHAGSGSDAASLSTKAVYDAATDEYVVNGSKVFISGAGTHTWSFRCSQ